MKLWEAFAAALLMARRPRIEDHVGRVEAAMRRVDLGKREKAAVAAQVADADARGRAQVARVSGVLRWRHAKRQAAPQATRFTTLREDIEAMLTSLDGPRKPEGSE